LALLTEQAAEEIPMPRIHTLPDDVTRQIAAGEVVERPASVVKELVENAIDAGARRVFVRTSGAGEDLIEVRDDGRGMSGEDLVLAPRNFSTSKIRQSADLYRLSTYGFRGEALASISSVSRFEIVSSDQTDGEGWRVSVEGKETSPCEPAPHERGTTVRVRDLFFNTPARKRFLKTPLTERKRILETVLSFALILPDIEFHFVDDNRHVLDFLPATSWRERVASVLGGATMKHIVPVEQAASGMNVRGFTSLPSYTRSNRMQQYFFVNRRPVREKTLQHALQDAYRNVIPFRRFPAAVLSLEIDPEEVDVNVHPGKMEVRVRNEKALFGAVRSAIKTATSARSESHIEVSAVPGSGHTKPGLEEPQPGELFEPPGRDDGATNVISLRERVKDAFGSYMENHMPRPTNPPLSLKDEEVAESTREAVEDFKRAGSADERLYWQFNNSYIFIQVRGGIVVIDQHAAHERIIFDDAKKQLEDQAPLSQQILFRINLELSMAELEVFQSSRQIFKKLGFDLEPFGGKSILVRGYPQGLKNWAEGKLLLQIFDDILQERIPGDTLTDKIVASFACRSAIKAGKKLSLDEMKLLADQLFAVENPYSCPHGRPTIHRISVEDVERWFHRR
jgi:DNA mismatch repair protein MutL